MLVDGVGLAVGSSWILSEIRWPETLCPAEAFSVLVAVLPSMLAPMSSRPGVIGFWVLPVNRKFPPLSVMVSNLLFLESLRTTKAPGTALPVL